MAIHEVLAKSIIQWKTMKKKYHTAGTGLKYNRNIVKRGKIDTSNTQIQVMAAHFPCLVDVHVQVVLLNLSNSFMYSVFSVQINGSWLHPLIYSNIFQTKLRGPRGRYRTVVVFIATYAIVDYHHWCCEFESRSGRGVQHYVIKFVNDLRQVGGFIRVLRFLPTIIMITLI